MSLLACCDCEQERESSSQTAPRASASADTVCDIEQTGHTAAVPAEYFKTAEHQGEVVRIEYESRDYVRDESAVTKEAYVYLPCGYDENDTDTRYDIVYLMHDGGGHPQTRNALLQTIENIKNNALTISA